MTFTNTDRGYIVRLIKGEKIVETLTNFCSDNSISSGVVSGLGGASDITLGYYKLDTKEYVWKDFPEVHEILSLNGNVATVNDSPFLHLHVALSNENFDAIGGHLKEATVAATCEVSITDLNAEITREMDDQIGLKLLSLPNEMH